MKKLIEALIGSSFLVGLIYYMARLKRKGKKNSKSITSSQLFEEETSLVSIFDNKPLEKIFWPGLCRKYILPLGFKNYGNTCYLNALIQALAPCNLFREYISHSLQNNNLQPLTYSFHKTLQRLDEGTSAKVDKIYMFLQEQFTNIFAQEDAYELWVYLQEKLSEERLFNNKVGMMQIFEDSESRILSRGVNPFMSSYEREILCMNCGNQKPPSGEIFYNLTLQLTQSGIIPGLVLSLPKKIQQFFQSEIIEDYKCIKCSIMKTLHKFLKLQNPDAFTLKFISFLKQFADTKELQEETFESMYQNFIKDHWVGEEKDVNLLEPVYVKIQKRLKLSKPPKILCIHLNRHSYDWNGNLIKNNSYIPFPSIIDLSPYIKHGGYSHFKYKLQSLIEHIGDASQGHYVSFRRFDLVKGALKGEIEREIWIGASDDQIQFATSQQVFARSPYMLFYQIL